MSMSDTNTSLQVLTPFTDAIFINDCCNPFYKSSMLFSALPHGFPDLVELDSDLSY